MSEKSEMRNESSTALRSCKLCGKEISPYSPFCRNCGHPQGSTFPLWLLAGFLVLLIIFYTGIMLFCTCNVERFRVDEEPVPKIEKQNSQQVPPQEKSGSEE